MKHFSPTLDLSWTFFWVFKKGRRCANFDLISICSLADDPTQEGSLLLFLEPANVPEPELCFSAFDKNDNFSQSREQLPNVSVEVVNLLPALRNSQTKDENVPQSSVDVISNLGSPTPPIDTRRGKYDMLHTKYWLKTTCFWATAEWEVPPTSNRTTWNIKG